MAARKNRFDPTYIRTKIQTTQLIKRLTEHANGSVDLSATQVRSIEILLKKSIPDLSSVQLSGDAENPVTLIQRTIRDHADD